MFDVEDFRAYMLSDRMMDPDTVRRRLNLLDAMRDAGLDVDAFLQGQDEARVQVRKTLARLRGRDDLEQGLANYSKALACLRDYAGIHLRIPYPRTTDPDARAYTEHEWKALRAFRLPGDRALERQIRAVMDFAYYTAMRPGELCRATQDDLDPETSRAYVRHPQKNSPRRWLRVEREMWSPKRAFGAWMRTADDQLWMNAKGEVPSSATMGKWMRDKVAPATGVEAQMYRFRHTRAVALHRAGLDVVYIKTYLGHSKLETTWNYLRRLGMDLDDAFDNITLPGINRAVR